MPEADITSVGFLLKLTHGFADELRSMGIPMEVFRCPDDCAPRLELGIDFPCLEFRRDKICFWPHEDANAETWEYADPRSIDLLLARIKECLLL